MRAKEIKKKKVDEDIIDSLRNTYKAGRDVYNNTKMGQQHQANATEAAAEKKFSLNISTLIARAIQSGSVLQQTPTPAPAPAPQAPQPTAQDFKPMNTTQAYDNDRLASGTYESRQYKVFDTLLEFLIDEAPTVDPASQSMQIKPGSISNLIKSYVNNLVRQYKWQDNPELRTHSDQLADQIEGSVSAKLKDILSQKGSAMIQQIYKATATPINQLFNTMYQWEQTGQSADSTRQTQQSSSTPTTDDATSKSRAEIPDRRKRETIGKLGEFLSKAAQNPELLTSDEMKPYRDTLKYIADRL
jgi:hypothetical protein